MTTTTTTNGEPAHDLITAALPGDELHAVLAGLRAEGEVVPVTALGTPAFLLTSYAAVREYLGAHDVFPGGPIYEATTRPHIGDTFINMDGPRHDTYRRLATPAFRSRATARFVEHELTGLAHEVIDRFAEAGSGDLIAEYAQVLPFWSISRKLGLPIGSEERQRAWALALLAHPVDPAGAHAAAEAVTDFLRPIVEQRRREPADDVISQLLASEDRGTRLTDEEVFSHVRLIYAVGATTTSDGLSSLLHHILTRAELTERLRADPAAIPQVVRESLRFDPPVSNLPRLAPDGGRIGDVELPAGALVLCSLASANRDPGVFDDPDRFEVDRAEGDVLTFGFGTKFCPGSHLARQQLTCAVEVLLARLGDVQLVEGEPPTGSVLRRCEHLVACWAPSRQTAR
jgi:cytochrome P450